MSKLFSTPRVPTVQERQVIALLEQMAILLSYAHFDSEFLTSEKYRLIAETESLEVKHG